jgi:hypothetical protein
MNNDFSKRGKVVFQMTDYIRNMLDGLPDDFDGTAATQAISLLEFRTPSVEIDLGNSICFLRQWFHLAKALDRIDV